MKQCEVDNCGNPHNAKGFCNTHYGRLRRGGNPHIKSQIEKTPTERFFESFEKLSTTDCWEWTSYKANFGYGKLRANGREVRAHRFSYEYFVGPIPNGLCVLHKCDNPPCVNPKHLYIGTKRDNARDMIERGRAYQPPTQGEYNSQAKLHDGDIHVIRYLVECGLKQTHVANFLGISKHQVNSIVHKRSWAHVTEYKRPRTQHELFA